MVARLAQLHQAQLYEGQRGRQRGEGRLQPANKLKRGPQRSAGRAVRCLSPAQSQTPAQPRERTRCATGGLQEDQVVLAMQEDHYDCATHPPRY